LQRKREIEKDRRIEEKMEEGALQRPFREAFNNRWGWPRVGCDRRRKNNHVRLVSGKEAKQETAKIESQ
jgi:hypothetical protein